MIGKANGRRSKPPDKPGNIEPATRDTMNAESVMRTSAKLTSGVLLALAECALFQTAKMLGITTQ